MSDKLSPLRVAGSDLYMRGSVAARLIALTILARDGVFAIWALDLSAAGGLPGWAQLSSGRNHRHCRCYGTELVSNQSCGSGVTGLGRADRARQMTLTGNCTPAILD